MADLRVRICGVDFANPLIAASGCYGFGRDYEPLYPVSTLGGIALKGITREPRMGNPPPRVAETPSGMLNSVGLQNPGVDAFLRDDLPYLKGRGTVLIANIAGSCVEDYIRMAERMSDSDIQMIELNISCPNVKEGGVAFGVSCESAGGIVKAVRPYCKKPLIVKLSPNVTDIASIAKAVEAEGADALSLINTLLGMRINIDTARPVLANNTGGLSGPAVFPIAVRMVWQAAAAVQIPVIGLGGIDSAETAIEMMIAGASAIQVGTALFSDPMLPVRLVQGIDRWLDDRGISSVRDIVGTIRIN